MRAEARTQTIRAVARLGRAAGRSPAPPLPPRPAAPAAAAAPCAPPYGAASSAVAPRSRRRASDTTLRRRACASPTLSMRALPARAPCGRRLNTPFEPAGGSSYRPRPLQRGAQQRHHRWLYQSFHPSLLVARGAPVISPSHLMAMHQHGWQDRGWQDLGTDGRIVRLPKLFLPGLFVRCTHIRHWQSGARRHVLSFAGFCGVLVTLRLAGAQ